MRIDKPISIFGTRMLIVPLMALFLWACGSSEEGSISVNFVPAKPDIEANSISLKQNFDESTVGTIALDLVANEIGPENVFGVAFDFTFDSTYLEFSGHTAGTFLESTATQQVIYQIAPLENDPNVEVVGISQLDPDSGASGSGVLVTLFFKVLKEGSTLLEFKNQGLVDSSGSSLPSVNWYAGTIEVSK